MDRAHASEIMDRDDFPEELLARSHRDLDRVHFLLGNTSALIRAIEKDPQPVRRVLDVGCGYGGVLDKIRRKLHVDAIGVDLRPPPRPGAFPILKADATSDPLPEADVAISLCVAHHLSPGELAAMIQNVGRSCRRFIILDLVRSKIPLVLFQIFIGPLLAPESRADGKLSIHRAYTPDEFKSVVQNALRGTGGSFHHSVAPFSIRQIAGISYRPR